MKNPRTEYYVIENFKNFDPCSVLSPLGSVYHDGSMYRLCSEVRVPIALNGTLYRILYAVRNSKRSHGTVDMLPFFRAWRDAGLSLGSSHDFQIFMTDGYFSSGFSNVVVGEGSS
jgi:endo-1,4-beta-xylanase